MEMDHSAANPKKIDRVESLLEQWEGREGAFELACVKNYGVERVLSRDIYYSPFPLFRIPDTSHVMTITAGDIMSCLYKHESSKFFCLDLRKPSLLESGKLAESLNVEGSLWKSELMLEGVMRCLHQLNGQVCEIMRFDIENCGSDGRRSSGASFNR